MVFDCSFTEYGSYGEMGNAWESMQINSVSVVPEGTTDVESVYSADTANMSDVSVICSPRDVATVCCKLREFLHCNACCEYCALTCTVRGQLLRNFQ